MRSASADIVRLKFTPKVGTIHTLGFKLTDVQAKLKCNFLTKRSSKNVVSRRYPFTSISSDNSDPNLVTIKIKKSSLTEFLPGLRVISCAYILVVIGTNEEGYARIGDIVLMGRSWGEMPPDELEMMLNSKVANIYLAKRLSNLQLEIGEVNGKVRIIEI